MQQEVSISLFLNGAMDRIPRRLSLPWDLLCMELAQPRPYHPELNTPEHPDGAKLATQAISQACYKDGTTRKLENIEFVQSILLDFDNKTTNPVSMITIGQHLQSLGLTAFTYRTYSTSPTLEKFRVLVPLKDRFETYFDNKRNWDLFTEWVLDRLGLNQWRECIDIQGHLKNAASMAFLQCCPDPVNLQCYFIPGEPLIWSVEELNQFTPSPTIQKEMDESCPKDRGDLSWATPFQIDFKTLDLPALLRSQGLWVGHPKETLTGIKWECECPWSDEHTKKGHRQNIAGIIKQQGKWPGFNCFHSHSKSIKDIALLYGPEILASFARPNEKKVAGSLL